MVERVAGWTDRQTNEKRELLNSQRGRDWCFPGALAECPCVSIQSPQKLSEAKMGRMEKERL